MRFPSIKKAALFLVLAGSSSAFADEGTPTVVVSSFRYINTRDYLAEICGKVSGKSSALMRVAIQVDPGRNPGAYATYGDQTGHWCQVVLSGTGRAEVSLFAPESGLVAASTSAQVR